MLCKTKKQKCDTILNFHQVQFGLSLHRRNKLSYITNTILITSNSDKFHILPLGQPNLKASQPEALFFPIFQATICFIKELCICCGSVFMMQAWNVRGGKAEAATILKKTEGVLSRTSCNQQVRLQTIAQCPPPHFEYNSLSHGHFSYWSSNFSFYWWLSRFLPKMGNFLKVYFGTRVDSTLLLLMQCYHLNYRYVSQFFQKLAASWL